MTRVKIYWYLNLVSIILLLIFLSMFILLNIKINDLEHEVAKQKKNGEELTLVVDLLESNIVPFMEKEKDLPDTSIASEVATQVIERSKINPTPLNLTTASSFQKENTSINNECLNQVKFEASTFGNSINNYKVEDCIFHLKMTTSHLELMFDSLNANICSVVYRMSGAETQCNSIFENTDPNYRINEVYKPYNLVFKKVGDVISFSFDLDNENQNAKYKANFRGEIRYSNAFFGVLTWKNGNQIIFSDDARY